MVKMFYMNNFAALADGFVNFTYSLRIPKKHCDKSYYTSCMALNKIFVTSI